MQQNSLRPSTGRRALFMIVASAGLALTAGCGGGGVAPSASATHANISTGSGSSVLQDSGTFSLAFAKCMRAHGVPDFPDPDGRSGQLGPGSGIDPSSTQFQAALDGPCQRLAPPGWTGPGMVTR